ncbi:MAG: FkbM family methyltransferase [Flavobacterium sp.]|jgi:FkbM family methyltransferase|uniref:FkbM family methyltransferase n=1 Tax=Flavobacterium sp. TaxID=239 RepID=UPI0022BFFAFA|nr:FkbM family methyltransferase [Flavobacterium sp.]MCZ8196450.1 FkbM family methyltransferase [Flavobacterium sp.]
MLKKLVLFKLLKKHFAFRDSIALFKGIKNNKEEIYLPKLNRKIYLRNNTKDLETFEEIFLTNLYDTTLPIIPKTIVDAGANVGLASLFFHLKYPEASIVALEIESKNSKVIKKNTSGINNFELIEKGLFNKKSFFKIEDPYNASNSFQIREVTEQEEYDVESTTLDEILSQKKWDTIDILKIDIEGAEKDLFSSNYENWLPKTKVIMIETHDRMIPKCSYTVMNTINKYNFILYTTTEGTLVYYNLSLLSINI